MRRTGTRRHDPHRHHLHCARPDLGCAVTPLPPWVFIALPFVVSGVLLIACLISEVRFQRRVARITVGQVIPLPPRLRVVEPDAPASDPAPVVDLVQYRRDWGPAA